MDFEIESSGLGYIVYNSERSLKVDSRQSTVIGTEGTDIRTRAVILLVVAKAIFIRDTHLI